MIYKEDSGKAPCQGTPAQQSVRPPYGHTCGFGSDSSWPSPDLNRNTCPYYRHELVDLSTRLNEDDGEAPTFRLESWEDVKLLKIRTRYGERLVSLTYDTMCGEVHNTVSSILFDFVPFRLCKSRRRKRPRLAERYPHSREESVAECQRRKPYMFIWFRNLSSLWAGVCGSILLGIPHQIIH